MSVKFGGPLPVTVIDGVPQCPHGCGPMRHRDDGAWDCPISGPFWEQAGRVIRDALDRLVSAPELP